MPRGRDQAGNIWELDAQGNPVSLVQPAQTSFPGSIPGALVPPNPAKVAEQQRQQEHQALMDRLAVASGDRAAQQNAREQKKFESEDTMAPPPGDTAKTGEEYLATIPPSLAGQVKALAEGRRAFPTGSALRSPAVQQLIAAATQYDPTLDAANAATRVATRKKFTSGTTRDNITAINTALGHLGTLWQDAQKLNNFGSPAINAPVNAFESGILGDERYTNFNLTRHAVVDELEKAFRGSGGTQTGIEEWKQGINNSQSPKQLRGAVGKAVELLSSRLQALGDAYATGMGRSSDPMEFLNPHAKAVFNALGEGGDGVVPPLPKDFGGAPPILGGSDAPPPPPSGPPAIGPTGSPPMGGPPGGVPKADYSGLMGNNASLATGDPNDVLKTSYKTVADSPAAAALAAFVRHGRSYQDVAAYAQSHGFNPPSETDYMKAVAYQKANPTSTPNVDALRKVPMSFGEKAASSPLAAGVMGTVSAGTAGFADLAGRLIGGNEYDANRHALADVHPTANLVGNVIGGGVAALAAPAVLARIPGALGLAGRASNALGRFAPLAGDAAYGATYGANEDPDHPLIGGVTGGLAGMVGGGIGRSTTRGLANVIAPPAGRFGPAYAQGVFPTIGQRFGQSGFAGRAINTAEQAMQSFPGLGALVSRARQIPRDQFQIGGFNDALGDINRRLPDNMAPGTEPHAYASHAFDQAYRTARTGMQFVPDAAYLTDEQAFNQALGNGSLNATQTQQVRQRIQTAVGSRLGSTARRRAAGALNGEAYQRAGAELADTARDWARDGTTAPMANALNDYLTIFDNAARRNSNPQAVQMLDQADRGYAKLVRIQDASRRVGGDAGTFTPRGFDRSVQNTAGGVRSGPYLRGNALMQDYADAGRGLTDTLPNSGSAERLLTGQAVAGTGGFALGAPAAIAAHPGSLAPFALYAPGVNRAVTRLIAPRDATLPPNLAAPLIRLGRQVNDRATLIGRLAAPATIGWEIGQ